MDETEVSTTDHFIATEKVNCGHILKSCPCGHILSIIYHVLIMDVSVDVLSMPNSVFGH